MNYRLVLRMVGRALRLEAGVLLLPAMVSLIDGDGVAAPFFIAAGVAYGLGWGLCALKQDRAKMRHIEGFAVAALAWVALSLVGALPFYLSRYFPSFLDCFLEAVAGFTTTGMSVFREMEAFPRAILFWRALTQWIGGMGVLLLMIAISSGTTASAINLMRAETAGPSTGKITPRMRDTAKILYIIYVAMTAALFAALLAAGMRPFDALLHAMGTAGTGGMSSLNASMGGFGRAAQWVVCAFMFAFGMNYALIYAAFKRDWKTVWKDEELRLYVLLALVGAALVAFSIRGLGGSLGETLRLAAFQSVSYLTTTGYTTTDAAHWPSAARVVLLTLMLVGGCAGSTAGGMKVSRVRLLLKAVRVEMTKIVHPRAVHPVALNGKAVDDQAMTRVLMFFAAHALTILVASLLISFDTESLTAAFSAVVASVSNTGSGMATIGVYGNNAYFSPFSKLILTFCMLAGRLEFYPLFILFAPSVWRAKS